MNFILRLKNKATLTALVIMSVTIGYQIYDIITGTIALDQALLTDIIMTVIQGLVILGVVVDPTTSGIKDSDIVLKYTAPRSSDNDIIG